MDEIREKFTIETKIFCEEICENKNRKKELGCDIIDCFTEKEYRDFEMGYKSRDIEVQEIVESCALILDKEAERLENHLKESCIRQCAELIRARGSSG